MPSRAETRRRQLKKQEERKRQMARLRRVDRTRKQKQDQKEADAKEKRVANLFQRVVGLTAAQGFNRNLHPEIALISKAVSQNVLVKGAQQKRRRNDESNRVLSQYINKLYFLHIAWIHIEKNKMNDPGEEARLHARMRDETQKEINTVFEKIHESMSKRGTMYLPTLISLWNLDDYYIERLLNEIPGIKELSFKNQNGIYDALYEEYQAEYLYYEKTEKSKTIELQVRGLNTNQAYQLIPMDIVNRLKDIVYKVQRFSTFLKSYDPTTGSYSLYPEKFFEKIDNEEYKKFTYRLFGNNATQDYINQQVELQERNPWNNNNNNNNNNPWNNNNSDRWSNNSNHNW